MLSQWLWIMVCYAEPVVVNHVCYTEPNSCESSCVILSRFCLSYGVSCRAIGCVSYEPVVVNHGELWWSSRCESCVLCRLKLCALFIIWKNESALYITVICYIKVPFKDIQMYWCVKCDNNSMSQWLWFAIEDYDYESNVFAFKY